MLRTNIIALRTTNPARFARQKRDAHATRTARRSVRCAFCVQSRADSVDTEYARADSVTVRANHLARFVGHALGHRRSTRDSRSGMRKEGTDASPRRSRRSREGRSMDRRLTGRTAPSMLLPTPPGRAPSAQRPAGREAGEASRRQALLHVAASGACTTEPPARTALRATGSARRRPAASVLLSSPGYGAARPRIRITGTHGDISDHD